MIDPATAHRWVDPAVGATIDMRRVTWFIQADDPDLGIRSLEGLMAHVPLAAPRGLDFKLHQLEVVAEAATDLGIGYLDAAELSAALSHMPPAGQGPNTARAYQAACSTLAP